MKWIPWPHEGTGLAWMVVIPSLIGMVLNQLTKGKIKPMLGRV
ncbi:hypothetical protein [Peribacillus sp. YIM B13482]